MKNLATLIFVFFSISIVSAQETTVKKGHYNTSKFRQLKQDLPTPNKQHTASGAPGSDYTQQKVDYVMDITLDDKNQKIIGFEKITYHNNSKDPLTYLWVQLDQNIRESHTKNDEVSTRGTRALYSPKQFSKKFLTNDFDGGFKLQEVKDSHGNDLPYKINWTMMRIDLATPIAPGSSFEFSIKWWYNINNYFIDGGRSGFELFENDGNKLYIIAQFFPRLAVYNNVEGWQNAQFWGTGEFALEFGDYTVNITTPSDHILNGTGLITNLKELITKKQYNRFLKAQKTFNKPIIIVTQEEAEKASKEFSTKTKTWTLEAKNVRDFAFSSSRKFIWDGMAVQLESKKVMAYSLYPKEGNPLWEEHSSRIIANTLKEYSKFTFDYPYPKAISVNADRQGMEYPMICWNHGRPKNNKVVSDRLKKGMIGVITHEIGHNFFPMIVNSDERKWSWMDEGINTFVEIYAEEKYDSKLFPTSKYPKNIIGYMAGNQDNLTPIMTNSEDVKQFGSNAYHKPAAGLFILRETIMGPELFDYAFKTYANRWKFKHPTPADFFRTMEDASAMDLDWFWRGWFYTTRNNDIGIKDVTSYRVTDIKTKRATELLKKYGKNIDEIPASLYLVSEKSEEYNRVSTTKKPQELKILEDYLKENNISLKDIDIPNYFYEIHFEKLGGLIMPIIVEYTFEDGTKERLQYPAQVWRKNDKEVTKVFTSSKKVVSIVVDPDQQTADVNEANNHWPKKAENRFESFKTSTIKE
ncbi:MAG: M1 family metallopeptidase [Flavobacteriaceae bacterium]|nr:M1 family metallopeptidase [Flavobacteriaceae bacterium]